VYVREYVVGKRTDGPTYRQIDRPVPSVPPHGSLFPLTWPDHPSTHASTPTNSLKKPTTTTAADGDTPPNRTVLAIRASVPPEVRRFAFNLCPGPLSAEEAGEPAPSEVLAHFNPRRIYKGGAIVYNSRRWVWVYICMYVCMYVCG
jgi:hypothetical protein